MDHDNDLIPVVINALVGCAIALLLGFCAMIQLTNP
jgi:hypothetical protein